MKIDPAMLPSSSSLVRLEDANGIAKLALWRDASLFDLSAAADPALHSLDALLSLPVVRIRDLLGQLDVTSLPTLEPSSCELLAPVQSQEVWAAGVTYLRSREARMEEAASKDIYAQVYEAERPELFFKAAGWRVVPPGGSVGVRSDSSWDVPEPELAVLSNAQGEVVAYSCGNDMSSRSIEGENPLFLPQAKVYDASCAIGPAAVLAWRLDPADAEIRMRIERGNEEVFAGTAHVDDMVRQPAELAAVLRSCYTLPSGAWLLTGTSLVPDPPYTALPGDCIHIEIEGLGELRNDVVRIAHSGASALPRIPDSRR